MGKKVSRGTRAYDYNILKISYTILENYLSLAVYRSANITVYQILYRFLDSNVEKVSPALYYIK